MNEHDHLQNTGFLFTDFLVSVCLTLMEVFLQEGFLVIQRKTRNPYVGFLANRMKRLFILRLLFFLFRVFFLLFFF